MRPPRHTILLSGLALLALGACSRPDAESGAGGGLAAFELPRVRVQPVVQREMVQRLTTTTLVRSQHQVSVLPQASGLVLELLAEEGDRVEAGQLLARLDGRDAEAAVQEARVALREAENGVAAARIALREAEAAVVTARLTADQTRRSFERNEKAGLVSEQELDKLRLEREMAEREHVAAGLLVERRQHDLLAAETALERSAVLLERSELQLSFTEVRAPFTGHVAERLVNAGDSVGGSTPLFVLVDLDDLVAVVHRPQRELALFLPHVPGNGAGELRGSPADGALGGGALGGRVGDMEIRATAEAYPGLSFPGEVLRISPAIDQESGSFRITVRLHPSEQGTQLLPGMLVRISLVTARRPDALVVPKKAVQREGDALVIWRVREGRAGRVLVEEGFSSDDELEVRPLRGAALAAGDRIVVVGNRDLEEGDEVEVFVDPAPPQPGGAAGDDAADADPAGAGAQDA